MAIEEVGVKLVAESEAQFMAAMTKADKAVKGFGQTTADTSQQVEKSTSALKDNSLKFTELTSFVSLAERGLGYLQQAFKVTVDETQKYNQSIIQLSRITGTGTEETSRLVQWTDDLGLEMGVLETAARGAAMKGISLTTDNLAKMSDQYLKLAPGTERNTYLLDKFGRSGLEMARIMEAGSDKIKSMSDAIEGGLIVTNQAAKASEDYRKQVDGLSDAWAGYMHNVGNKIIPQLVDILNDLNVAMIRLEQSKKSDIQTTSRLTEKQRLAVLGIDSATNSYIGMGKAIENTTTVMIQEGDSALQDAIKYWNQVTINTSKAIDPTQQYISMIGSQKYQLDNYNKSLDAQAKATAAAGQAAAIAALSMKPMTAEILLANSGLKEGTPAWWEFARSLGLVDENAANMATKLQIARAEFEKTGDMERYRSILNSIKQDMLGIPSFVNTTWNIGIAQGSQSVYNAMQNAINNANRGGTTTTTTTTSGGRNQARATGGPVSAGWPYMVGERGPEPFIPAMNGYILSKADAERIYASQVAASMPAAMVSAGPSSYSYSNANNYNLSVMTSQSAAVVQRSFAIMKLLAG